MADTSNLSVYLKDLADAIREKKSTEEQIPAANFDTEIRSIETGTDTSDATATENDVLLGKTAYGANGKFTGTLKGARYYATEKEMYTDDTVEPITYGLVYSETNNPLKNGDSVQIMKFLQTVVLDTPISNRGGGQIMGYNPDTGIHLNLIVNYSSTEVYIQSMEGTPNIRYTSEDGITYIKESGEDEYDLGGYVTVNDFENLLDIIGKFITKTVYYQGGFYKYDIYKENNIVKMFDTRTEQLTSELFELPEELVGQEYGGHLAHAIIKTYHYDSNRKVNIVDTVDLVGPLYNNYLAKNGSTFCIVADGTLSGNWIKHYDFSLSNPLVSTDTLDVLGTYNTENIYYNIPSDQHLIFGSAYTNPLQYVSSAGGETISFTQHPMTWEGYKIAGNQYNLTDANQILPGVQAYGKNGIVTGDGSIYDNLDMTKVLTSYMGVPEDIAKKSYSEIFNTCLSMDTLPKDGLILYNTHTDFTPGKIHYITDYLDEKGNIIFLTKSKNLQLKPFTIDHSSTLLKYSTDYDVLIHLGYYSGNTSSNEQKLECFVYDSNGELLNSYLTSDTYMQIDGQSVFYYNDEVYVVMDTSNSSLYKFNGSTLSLVKSGLGASFNRIVIDSTNGIVYLAMSNGTYRESTLKTLDLKTNTLTIIDSGKVLDLFTTKNFIGYIYKDSGIVKYKRKTETSFKYVDTGLDVTNSYVYFAENSDGTKLSVLANESNSDYQRGGAGIIDVSTNVYTPYVNVLHWSYTDNAFSDIYDDEIYFLSRTGYCYKITPSGERVDLLTTEYPLYKFKVVGKDDIVLGVPNNIYGVATSVIEFQHTAKNFELGMSNEHNNFFAKDKNTMFVIGNYVDDTDIPISQEEYNTALDTAKQIEGSVE